MFTASIYLNTIILRYFEIIDIYMLIYTFFPVLTKGTV